MLKRKSYLLTALLAVALITPTVPANAAAGITYMEAANSAVSLEPIATSGDYIGNYLIGGVPDGMGVIKSGNKLRIITNHEWSSSNAIAAARASNAGLTNGSYVSEMHYDLSTKEIVAGKDFMQYIEWFDYNTLEYTYEPTVPKGADAKDQYGSSNHANLMNRFCSSTLAEAGTFYSKSAGVGYKGAVYLTGEEGSDESRGFAGNEEGDFVQMPRFGLAAWETFVPAPTTTKSTVIFGNEDGSATDSQLWMYKGTKQKDGSWYEQAGLANGSLYVLATDVANDNEFRAKYGKGKGAPISFETIDWKVSGKNQNGQARQLGMELSRVEDGHFDPKKPNDYYFITTESNKDPKATAPNPSLPTVSRDGGALWRLRLKDVNDPLKGGTLTMLLDGSEELYLAKPDNIVVDDLGNILIQEDPGNNAAVSRIVSYRISDGKLATIAKFKSEYFAVGAEKFITQDEESSGIIDVTKYLKSGSNDKAKYYMLVAQVHTTPTKSRPDLTPAPFGIDNAVEGGQWYVMKVSNWEQIYS
jgi:secreted PhoX family phosphatase